MNNNNGNHRFNKGANKAKKAARLLNRIHPSAVGKATAIVGKLLIPILGVLLVLGILFMLMNGGVASAYDAANNGYAPLNPTTSRPFTANEMGNMTEAEFNQMMKNYYNKTPTATGGTGGGSYNYEDNKRELAAGLDLTDNYQKTGVGLATFCKNAARIKCGYVLGFVGNEVSVENMRTWQAKHIGTSEADYYACSDEQVQYVLDKFQGKPAFDCANMIMAYMGFNAQQNIFTGNYHGYGQYYHVEPLLSYAQSQVAAGNGNAGTISRTQTSLPDYVPIGAAVVHDGHIGVFVDRAADGKTTIVEAYGWKQGVVENTGLNSVRSDKWTYWFKLPCVHY